MSILPWLSPLILVAGIIIVAIFSTVDELKHR